MLWVLGAFGCRSSKPLVSEPRRGQRMHPNEHHQGLVMVEALVFKRASLSDLLFVVSSYRTPTKQPERRRGSWAH